MKNIALGAAQVPNVALGLMRIADLSDAAIRELVGTAREVGITFFDHADIYGGERHRSERRFAEAMRFSSSERAEIRIQSKVGIVTSEPMYDFSYEHIVSSVEESLQALATDYLDVLELHRPDPLVEPEEVARAFDELYDAGKVRAFGVSNHTPRQIDLLQRWVRQPIVADQMQLSLGHAGLIAQGISANTDNADGVVTDGGGLIDYCRLEGITLQAWSPLGGPHGPLVGNPASGELSTVLDRIAGELGVPATAVAIGWITRHPAGIQAIIGTTNPQRVRDAALGSDLALTRPQWWELLRAAGYEVP